MAPPFPARVSAVTQRRAVSPVGGLRAERRDRADRLGQDAAAWMPYGSHCRGTCSPERGGWATPGTFAGALRGSVVSHGGGLLLVGTPEYEPWHPAAHLADEAAWSGAPEPAPTLVRHDARPADPAHPAVGPGCPGAARRGETLLVVAPGKPPSRLPERISDARRAGADPAVAGPLHGRAPGAAPRGPPVPDGSEPDLDTVRHPVTC